MRRTSVVCLAGAVLFAVSILGGLVFAEGSESEGVNKGMKVTVSGTNYCVACTLGKIGAVSQCSAVGHIHALRVKEVKTEDGKVLDGLKGKTLHYLYNERGKEYAQGHHGEEVTFHGTLYEPQRILDLGKASAEGSDEKKG